VRPDGRPLWTLEELRNLRNPPFVADREFTLFVTGALGCDPKSAPSSPKRSLLLWICPASASSVFRSSTAVSTGRMCETVRLSQIGLLPQRPEGLMDSAQRFKPWEHPTKAGRPESTCNPLCGWFPPSAFRKDCLTRAPDLN
jgi:hypothetical protein